MKATGEGASGITGDLDVLTESIFVRAGRKWYVRYLPLMENYASALAIDSDDVDVKLIGRDECRIVIDKIGLA